MENYSFKKDEFKKVYISIIVFFIASGVLIGIYSFYKGDFGHMVMGLATPLFLLIPFVLKLLKIKPAYRLYSFLFLFCIVAYNIGCSLGGYEAISWLDKTTHFVSGILFTLMGFCFYFVVNKNKNGIKDNWIVAFTYALFFSTFIAVCWEVIEFLDFNITGHDGQHTLTTGVFDTMQDLISCLLGSFICIGSYILYVFDKFKGILPKMLEEFYYFNYIAK